jgi:predicted SnoaL-like aldol condensation-catalyzing enzyme
MLQVMILVCALVSGAAAHADAHEPRGRMMAYSEQEQRNLDLVRGLFRDVLEPMSSKAVDRYISPDYIQHNQSAEPGREGLKKFLDTRGPMNPNPTHDIKRMFADGDHVIVHYNFRRGDGGLGFAVMDIFRIEDGLIKEHWDVLQPVPTSSPNPNSPF